MKIGFIAKHVKSNCSSDQKRFVDITKCTEVIITELNNCGFFERLKNIPQLGAIRVKKDLKIYRYEYVLLQLHFQEVLRNRKPNLKYSYSNSPGNASYLGSTHKTKYSGWDILQTLTVIYNIGHFNNTFTSSKAFVSLLNNKEFKNFLLKQSDDERFKEIVDYIHLNNDYLHAHFINSWIMLERCDQSKDEIKFALDLIYNYIFLKNGVIDDNKLLYFFSLFKQIRSVAYYAYDLQIANQPFTIDLCNDNDVGNFLEAIVTQYDDNTAYIKMLKCFQKLLNETLYNKKKDVIAFDAAAKGIVKKYSKDKVSNFLVDFVLNENSIFNEKLNISHKYDTTNVLKISFSMDEMELFNWIYQKMNHTESICCGYYHRNNGNKTLVIGLRKNCNDSVKASFHVLSLLTSKLYSYKRNMNENTEFYDKRYINIVKFFLQTLLPNSQAFLNKTITYDDEKVVFVTRGKKQKILLLDHILDESKESLPQNNEVETIKGYLERDNSNDISVIIPCSILFSERDNIGKMRAELDGLVIHPNRNIVVFFESKIYKKVRNKDNKAIDCLVKKLDQFEINYRFEDIERLGKNAYYEHHVK